MCIFEIDMHNLVALKYMVCSGKKSVLLMVVLCLVPLSLIFHSFFPRANYKTVPSR